MSGQFPQIAALRFIATALCTGTLLLGQPSGNSDVRSELSRFQDMEYRLGMAYIEGVQTDFAEQFTPSIRFHSGGVISGTAGANRYYATVSIAPNGQFSIEEPGIAITRVRGEAQVMKAQSAFLSALQSARMLKVENDRIQLGSADSQTNLTFARPAAADTLSEVKNTELRLVRFQNSGTPVGLPSSVTITLTFGDNGQVSGRSAVNTYGGQYTLTSDGKITVQNLVSTQMAGPSELMTLEHAYFDALARVIQIAVNGKQVTLSIDNTVLEFSAAPVN